jgi:AcrR family transcriptional regulator
MRGLLPGRDVEYSDTIFNVARRVAAPAASRRAHAGARRPYDSPARRARADATRGRIVDAARRLFAARGYATTTIDAIAKAARVAVPTVYAVFGSKRAVLLALLDRIEADAQVSALADALKRAAGHPDRQLALFVDFEVRLFARGADVIGIARHAGHVDADLALLWRRGEARRRAGVAPLDRDWKRRGALRADLTVRQALDILWALTGADAYHLFVDECAWSLTRYRAWLTATLRTALLA